MKLKKGSTRCVLLIFSLAIKVPRLLGVKYFLQGWLANIQEATFSKLGDTLPLAPVKLKLLGGLIVVMPNCEPKKCMLKDFIDLHRHMETSDKLCIENIVEFKSCSIGVYQGKPVAVDYGS